MAGQLRILVRPVGSEMGAPALRAGERAVRDQPRQEVRCFAEALEPGCVADEACVLPQGSANFRRDRFQRLGGRRRARSGREIGLLKQGESRPPTEHEALEQRVRREAVRSVDPGARALSGCVEPGQLGAPVEIGDDAAHRVVGRRRHRNRLDGGVEPGILERPDHRREAVPVDRAEVEQRRAARSDLTCDDVPRRKLVGETMAAVIEQERARAAQSFAEEDARAPQSGRMKLDELEICDPGSSRAVG